MFQVPVTNDAAQSFVTQLGEFKLQFDIQWNDRSNQFSLTLINDDTQEIYFQGVPLLLGTDLLEPYNYGLGALMVVDTTNQRKEATLETFGVSSLLYWFDEQEKLDAVNSAI